MRWSILPLIGDARKLHRWSIFPLLCDARKHALVDVYVVYYTHRMVYGMVNDGVHLTMYRVCYDAYLIYSSYKLIIYTVYNARVGYVVRNFTIYIMHVI